MNQTAEASPYKENAVTFTNSRLLKYVTYFLPITYDF